MRNRYDLAKEQLAKGEKMFDNVLKPLANLSDGWTYLGFVSFPEIEDRTVLNRFLKLNDSQLKFVLTKEEIQDLNFKWLNESPLKTYNGNNEDSYKNLISLIVGSHYISFLTPAYSPSQDIIKTKDKLLNGAKLTDSQPLPEHRVNMDDIKGKALWGIENILFWNDEQMQLLSSLKKFEPTIIVGDFGCGKTVVAASFAEYCHSHPEMEQVYYISALDVTNDKKVINLLCPESDPKHFEVLNKSTENIFDIFMQQRFSGNVKYVNITDLRKLDFRAPELKTNKLITRFLDTIENKNKTVIIIDELSWSNGVRSKKEDAPNLDEILQLLRKEFKMSLIILSTKSLLTKTSEVVSQKELSGLVSRNGYNYFELRNVLRNSQSIVSATSVAGVNKWFKDVNVKETIQSGHVSTIVGPRPTCILYRMKKYMKNDCKLPTKHKVWANCVNIYLEKVNINANVTNLTVAILCFLGVDPKLLKEELSKSMITTEKLHLFGAFYNKMDKSEQETQKSALNTWLSKGGLLVAAGLQFQGCEADVVIVVGTDLSHQAKSHRVNLTRGAAHLCFITGDTLVNKNELSTFFDVHDIGINE